MGKLKEKPRYYVVSMRIHDDEKKQLEAMQGEGKNRKTAGDVMRASLFGDRKVSA